MSFGMSLIVVTGLVMLFGYAVKAYANTVNGPYSSKEYPYKAVPYNAVTGMYTHICKYCGDEKLSDGRYNYRCECTLGRR